MFIAAGDLPIPPKVGGRTSNDSDLWRLKNKDGNLLLLFFTNSTTNHDQLCSECKILGVPT